jgi:hypothetical protein
MTQQYAGTPPPGADTPPPVDERPPYGPPSRWPAVVFIGILAAVLVSAVVVGYYTVRTVWRLVVGSPTTRGEVIMFAAPDQPYAGTTYRAEFYDENFRQLDDRELRVALPSLYGPAADAYLDQFARQCAAIVDSTGSQRCFKPRLVVYGADGARVREWRVAA